MCGTITFERGPSQGKCVFPFPKSWHIQFTFYFYHCTISLGRTRKIQIMILNLSYCVFLSVEICAILLFFFNQSCSCHLIHIYIYIYTYVYVAFSSCSLAFSMELGAQLWFIRISTLVSSGSTSMVSLQSHPDERCQLKLPHTYFFL